LRLSSKVASGAILHARLRQANRVFCGHTHRADFIERDTVSYYNSGGWADSPPTYLTVDSEGVRIHEYHEAGEDHGLLNADEEAEYESVAL
jgi:UDP-2,3-diacylglucosamine pyrophosphatase LpxH